jgi:hypothetical protein
MDQNTDEFVKDVFTRVRTISIPLGQDASLNLESSVFGSTYWMLEFPDGGGQQIDSEIATALIAAVNGEKTPLEFGEYFMSPEEADELKQQSEENA